MKDIFGLVRDDKTRIIIRFVVVIVIAILLFDPSSSSNPLEQPVVTLCALLGNFFLFLIIGITVILGIIGWVLNLASHSTPYKRKVIVPLIQFGAMVVTVLFTFMYPGISRLTSVVGLIVFVFLDLRYQFLRTSTVNKSEATKPNT